MDAARKRTDKWLSNTELMLERYYNRQTERAVKLLEKFYNRHKKTIETKIKEYKSGAITKKEYRAYMLDKILLSRDFKKTVGRIAEVYTDINQNALHEIINTGMEKIYIDNYNATIKAIGGELID
jgi:Tfp pilus assembly protein PilE